MQNNANTENEPLDTEAWALAFEPYEGQPGPALTLGFRLTVLKRCLTAELPMIQEAINGLDCGMKVLFQHTQFHEVAYELFHRLIEGELTYDEEQLLKSLGLKF